MRAAWDQPCAGEFHVLENKPDLHAHGIAHGERNAASLARKIPRTRMRKRKTETARVRERKGRSRE
jgi:hypothetical protein